MRVAIVHLWEHARAASGVRQMAHDTRHITAGPGWWMEPTNAMLDSGAVVADTRSRTNYSHAAGLVWGSRAIRDGMPLPTKFKSQSDLARQATRLLGE